MSHTTSADPAPVTKSAIRKIALRLVPFVALMSFINHLDRTAIGFAAPDGMNDDLVRTGRATNSTQDARSDATLTVAAEDAR